MLTALKNLCADQSLTFRQIQREMNAMFETDLTRNACIGKARRLRLPARDITNNPAVKEMPVIKPFAFAPIAPQLPPRSKEPFTMTIYQLRFSGDCKWPSGAINDRPPFTYCGCRALSGMPYCAEHTRRAHTASRPRIAP